MPVSSASTRVLGISDLEKVRKKQIFFVITLDQYLVAGNFLISKAAWEGTILGDPGAVSWGERK